MVIDLEKEAELMLACNTKDQVMGRLYWFIDAIRISMTDRCAEIAHEYEPFHLCSDSECQNGAETKMGIEVKIRAEG
jgi:hypothetical protein